METLGVSDTHLHRLIYGLIAVLHECVPVVMNDGIEAG
jgi:hypothetical protein